jgi:hypothetical protein
MKFASCFFGLCVVGFVLASNSFVLSQAQDEVPPVVVTQSMPGQPPVINVSVVVNGMMNDRGTFKNSIEKMEATVSHLVFLFALEAAGVIVLNKYLLDGKLALLLLDVFQKKLRLHYFERFVQVAGRTIQVASGFVGLSAYLAAPVVKFFSH